MPSGDSDLPIEALRTLALALSSIGMPYAIIGGVAISVVSVPRYTKDVDAVLLHPDSNVENLVAGLLNFGLRTVVSDPLAFARKNRLVVLQDSHGTTIDLSLGVLPFEIETIEKANVIEVATGLSVPIASPEALVVMKCIASRVKDLEDIRNLLSVNLDIDRKKVLKTVTEFAEILEHPEMLDQLERLFKEHPVA